MVSEVDQKRHAFCVDKLFEQKEYFSFAFSRGEQRVAFFIFEPVRIGEITEYIRVDQPGKCYPGLATDLDFPTDIVHVDDPLEFDCLFLIGVVGVKANRIEEVLDLPAVIAELLIIEEPVVMPFGHAVSIRTTSGLLVGPVMNLDRTAFWDQSSLAVRTNRLCILLCENPFAAICNTVQHMHFLTQLARKDKVDFSLNHLPGR